MESCGLAEEGERVSDLSSTGLDSDSEGLDFTDLESGSVSTDSRHASQLCVSAAISGSGSSESGMISEGGLRSTPVSSTPTSGRLKLVNAFEAELLLILFSEDSEAELLFFLSSNAARNLAGRAEKCGLDEEELEVSFGLNFGLLPWRERDLAVNGEWLMSMGVVSRAGSSPRFSVRLDLCTAER